MNDTSTSRLGTESIGRLLLTLSVPSIIAQVVNMLYNIVDRVYIGHMADSASALGGLSVALPVITLIMAVTQLFGTGGAPLAAIKLGQQRHDDAEKIMMNSFVALVASGIILTVVILIFAEPLLYLFGAEASTIVYGTSYIRIYALGTVSVQIAIGMNAYINTQGFTKIGMDTVLIGAVLNIVLDPLFIFVFNMGVQGAALATIISQSVSAIWVLKFLLGHQSTMRLKKEYAVPEWKLLVSIMELGVSPFIMSATEGLLQISFNNQMRFYGSTLAVSTMSILLSLSQMLTLPIQGICMGAQPISSYNYGAKNYDRVRKTFKLLFAVCFISSFVIGSSILIFSKGFAAIFTNAADGQTFAGWAIRIYIFGLLFFGAQIACQQTFMALGQAKLSLLMALFRKVILLIPLIFILPNLFGTSGFAIEASLPIVEYVKDAPRVFCVLLAEPISDILAAATTTTLFMRFYHTKLKSLEA